MDQALIARLTQAGVGRGDMVGLTLVAGVGLGLAAMGGIEIAIAATEPAEIVAAIESALRPRWVVWSSATASQLVAAEVRLATAWDVTAVHRLLTGQWRAEPGRVWADMHGLPLAEVPGARPFDLFNQETDDAGADDNPIRPDGHLSVAWCSGGWATTPRRLARWAGVAAQVAGGQQARVTALSAHPAAPRTARSESAAELLCAELAFDGLPVNRGIAEGLIAAFVGPRPRNESEAAVQRAARDNDVLCLAPPGGQFDLRSPGQVKSLLRFIGIEVPDTRAWRLEARRHEHPLVEALLTWRRAERMATTFGYSWLDEHVGVDGRLRGAWTGCDGAAGRMTASAGLHNMPSELRSAVVAEDGHVFIRADLGQIEPRVLASVSGDRALARATLDDDMYALVARQLGVDRALAKVAMLGAMYGQTSGLGAQALRGLQTTYPIAMAYLENAARSAGAGQDLRTYGGRLVRMGQINGAGLGEREARSRAAAQGRYGRNALVQGAAAELFKVWAVTVRARARAFEAQIVLCLHDELLVQAPVEHAESVAALLEDCLQEAACRWAPDDSVRFVADISVIASWSDAKE